METPLAISNFFIKKAMEEGANLTPMKLLKLVYITNGWHLALTDGEPLIGEAAQAWKYGPVIPSVYKTFKVYGRGNIGKLQETVISDSDGVRYGYPLPDEAKLGPFLNKVWEMYRNFDGLQLSALTHEDGTPWDITYRQKGENATIPNDLILEHYKSKLKKPQAQ